MLSKYEPFPDRKRVDGNEWFSWSKIMPPPGQEFEFRRIGETKTQRAMRRMLVERYAGMDFFCAAEAAAIVTEDGDVSFGFNDAQSVVWRPINIIVSS